MNIEAIKRRVRTVKDWPVKGINFRDITTLFAHPESFRGVVDWMQKCGQEAGVGAVAGVDARGFVLAGALADRMGLPIILVRKKGKLPYRTLSEDYTLEYGSATIEIHADAVPEGAPVLLVDDLIATGGTLMAASRLLQRAGAGTITVAAILDLSELGGSAALRDSGLTVESVCAFTEAE